MSRKSIKRIKKRLSKLKRNKTFIGFASIILGFILIFSSFNLLFLGKIYPNILVAGQSLGGKTPKEASDHLAKNVKAPDSLTLSGKDKEFGVDLNTINFSYNFTKSAENALNLYRSGNVFFDQIGRFLSLFRKKDIGLWVNIDEERLTEHFSIIADEVAVAPVYPSIELENGNVLVKRGSTGYILDLKTLRALFGEAISLAKDETISLPLKTVDPTITESEAAIYKARAERLIGKSITWQFEYQAFTLKDTDLFALLDPKNGYQEEEIEKVFVNISEKISREPQSPVFVFEAGRVKEFAPAKDGIRVNETLFKEMLVGNLKSLAEDSEVKITLVIPVKKASPDFSTEDVNNLGIKELLGRGDSRFASSISSRIYNIDLASSRFNGVLVDPGDTFSFNQVLGDVSAYTGYKQAYIIKDGRTVLGDGGGVCQVSTTLFRAVLDAGLPIVERRAHSYRVGYYEQDSLPGLDATVYAPTTDLKFRNDTPAHILIQTYFDSTTAGLAFEIYGTSDGRVANISKPVISSQTPPPEDLYQDDPSLPLGTIKQIDYKAWGAKVSFNYTVTRNGETIYQKTFYSNYRPWQAVFLQGTGQAD